MSDLTSGWYKGSISHSEITEIEITNTIPVKSMEYWDASTDQDGSVMCYRSGTKITVVCDGITAIGDHAFFKFIELQRITGLGAVTTIGDYAFCYTPKLMYIDLVPQNLTSIGISAFRMSSAEDGLDLSGVSLSNVGIFATRLKRWSKDGLAALKNVVFPRTIYFDVPNPDNQNNYPDVPFGTENGKTVHVADSGCSALACYHIWNYLNAGTSRQYDNWLDWYNETLNADGTFADTNKMDGNTIPMMTSRLGWACSDKIYANDAAQLQMIIDNLVNGCPTYLSVNSVHNFGGTHAVIAVGCDMDTHKLAIVDSCVTGTTGVVSWIAFEDIFVEGTSEGDGIRPIDYKRPVLAPNSTWYTQGGTSIERSVITEIDIRDSYEPTGAVTASWDASAAGDQSVMVYVEGTKLTIAGNGSGKIVMNADSSYLFSDVNRSNYFTNVVEIRNANLLDSSRVTSLMRMCEDCFKLKTIDCSKWNTSNLTSLRGTFQGCESLEVLDVSNWNVSSVESIDRFLNMYGALRNNSLSVLDISKWKLSKVADYTTMCTHLRKIKTLDFSGVDTTDAEIMKNMLVGLNELERITIGDKFSFDGDGTISNTDNVFSMPVPLADYIAGADGKWRDIDGNVYSPSSIPDKTFATYYASARLASEDSDRMVIVRNCSMKHMADAIRVRCGITGPLSFPDGFTTALLPDQ